MIIKTNKISFKITKKNHLKIKPNFFVDRQYPELEDLEITPSTEEQKFKSNMYGYDEVTVKGIETEELNVIPNTETQINEGIFNKVIVSGDSNLISENIKEGTTIFGVEGTNKILDTTDATATVEDIAKGKTAYVNGEKIEGTVETIEGSASSQSQKIVNFGATIGGEITFTRPTLFKKNASNMITLKTKNIAETIKLTPEQIVKGNTVLGVSGIAEVLDTSDATATENDILEGKTAYVNGEKIEGILKPKGDENATLEIPNATNFTIKNCITKIKELDISGIANLTSLFESCNSLVELPETLDTSSATNMYKLFYYCSAIETIPVLDCSNCTRINDAFRSCSALKNMGGVLNFGKAFTEKVTKYGNYTLSFYYSTNLTYESLLNIVNGLYDLNLTYDVANGGTLYRQSCNLNSKNIAKLQATEEGLVALAEANRKGWDII